MPTLAWLAVGGVTLTAGDIVFKYWALAPRPSLYVAGLALYLAGAMCLVQTYRSENIAVATAVFIIFNLASLLLASWLWFGEPVVGWRLVGLLLAVAAVAILEVA